MIVGEGFGLKHRSSPLSRLVLKLIRVYRVRTDGLQVVRLSTSREPPYLTGVEEVTPRRRASMLTMNERNISRLNDAVVNMLHDFSFRTPFGRRKSRSRSDVGLYVGG
jgi:hypothetical protein